MDRSPVFAIISSPSELDTVNTITSALGYQHAEVVEGTPATASEWIQQNHYSPNYIIAFIGDRSHDILPELDVLAEQCESTTRIVVIGETNDIGFYRALKDRGVVEYFNYAASASDVRNVLFQVTASSSQTGRVVAVYGGSSGDGSSMVALNTAYLLAKKHQKKTVLVDLDYQFGMVARQLELQPTYGIKEIFDHPERGVDGTLIQRMVVPYRDGLDIITSPQQLYFMPPVETELVREFVGHLAESYEYIILDVPHRWNNWVSATIGFSDHIMLVAQLLLKSITHSSRILNKWSESGLIDKPMSVIINRSGSRYKEAVHPKDFERIAAREIDHYLPNDIKTICQSENKGVPVSLLGHSQLANELERVASRLIDYEQG